MRSIIVVAVFCLSTLNLSALSLPPSEGEAAEVPALRIIAFGDSITGNRPGEAYHQHYIKWIDLVGLMIEAQRGLGSVVVDNAGYAGDATARRGDRPGAVNRFHDQVIARQPDIVLVLIGGNDAGGRVDRETTEANLQTMFAACRNAGIKVLAMQYATIYDPEEPGQAWKHLVENNDLIAATATANGHAALALQPHFDAAAEALGSHLPLVNDTDRVHLAPGGEMVVARAVFAALNELGWLQ